MKWIYVAGAVGLALWWLNRKNAAAEEATTYHDAAGNVITAGPQTEAEFRAAQAAAERATTYHDAQGNVITAGPQMQGWGY